MIRNAKESDLTAIFEINQQVLKSRWTYFDYHQNILLDNALFLVYEKNRCVVAYILIISAIDSADIHQIAVLKEFQNRGIASKLMNESLMILSQGSVENLFLEVNVNNKQALSFYHKHGFKTLRRIKNYYENEDALSMKKRLKIC